MHARPAYTFAKQLALSEWPNVGLRAARKLGNKCSMNIILNGENLHLDNSQTVAGLLDTLGFDERKVAVERNLEIVPKSTYCDVSLSEGDRLEIVHFIGGGSPERTHQASDDTFEVAGKVFKSRLLVGTGKYADFEENAAALDASGAEIVTVAVRRVNVTNPNEPVLMDYIDPKKYTYLPNTAGCFTAEDALRTLRLAREAGGWNLVKLEVLWDHVTLYPHMTETLKAAEILIKEDFKVMVYCSDDPIMAKRLEELGCAAIMPLAAPIGSGLGSAKSRGHPSHCRAGKCTGPRGCRGWNGVRCGGGHGAGLRRCAHEYRHRPSQISSENGARHETRRGSGAACVSCRAHAQEDVCRSFVTTCRVDLTDKFKEPNAFIRRAGS